MANRKQTSGVQPIPFYKLRFGEEAFDPIRLSNGKIGIIKYTKGGSQQVISQREIQLNGEIYRLSLPEQSSNWLMLPTGSGVSCDPKKLYDRILGYLKAVLKLPDQSYIHYIALYLLASWNYDEYPFISYLAFTGQPGFGKSHALDVCMLFAYNAFRRSGGASDAVLFRSIHNIKGTLSIDEAQRNAADFSSDFHKMLAEGTYKNGVFSRLKPTKDGGYEEENFSVFCPKIISGRSIPGDDAILSRTFDIRMTYYGRKELITNIDPSLIHSNEWLKEISQLRNDLLLYRQRRAVQELSAPCLPYEATVSALNPSPREHQILDWLLKECPIQNVFQFIAQAIESNRKNIREAKFLQFESQVLLATERVRSDPEYTQTTDIPLSRISLELDIWSNGKIDARKIGKILRSHGLKVLHGNRGNFIRVTKQEMDAILCRMNLQDAPIIVPERPRAKFIPPSSEIPANEFKNSEEVSNE